MGEVEYVQQPFETLALIQTTSIPWFLVDIIGQITHCD